jgi:hypothetical protein
MFYLIFLYKYMYILYNFSSVADRGWVSGSDIGRQQATPRDGASFRFFIFIFFLRGGGENCFRGANANFQQPQVALQSM